MELGGAASAALLSGEFELEGVKFVINEYFPAGGKDAFSLIKPRRAIQA